MLDVSRTFKVKGQGHRVKTY